MQTVVSKLAEPVMLDEVIETTCDICGAKVTNWGLWREGSKAAYCDIALHEFDKATGIETALEYDVCPNCFRRFIMDYLFKVNGVRARATVNENASHDWMFNDAR